MLPKHVETLETTFKLQPKHDSGISDQYNIS